MVLKTNKNISLGSPIPTAIGIRNPLAMFSFKTSIQGHWMQ